MTSSTRSISWQRIRNHRVGPAFITQEAAPRRGNHDVLLSVLSLERHGGGVRAGIDGCHPQLFAGLGIERAEAAVVGGADEDQASRGGDRAADIRASGFLLFGGEALGDSQN